ncbi:MAG: SDR family oxidoreductase [Gemmatimonadetes bacterium]|nr:SDR family oxidoreductase [Gemmatimonadota bacterium]
MPALRRVCITGAAGYLGTLLGARLAASGVSVTGVDVRPRGDGPVPVRAMDIRDPALATLLRDERIDAVVHLAAVLEPTRDRARDFDIDVNGTRHVIAACVAAGVRHLTVTSSGAAYGYHADNPVPLSEDHPLRGDAAFSYADHKRQVEALLAEARGRHPGLGQLVLRVGPVVGATTRNQITALFHRRLLLAVRGYDAPFAFVWDEDLLAVLAHGVAQGVTGVFNVAGSGALTMREIGALLGKPVLAVPAGVLRAALWVGRRLGVSRYGPEQVRFLQHRPVLSNEKLRREFGVPLRKTAAEAFQVFAEAQGLWRGA